MTLKDKVGTVTGILALMGIAISANIWFYSTFAKADDLVELEVQTIKTLRDYRVRQMVQDLNGLDTKEKLEGLSDYDQIRKEQLARELELETRRETD